MATPARPRKAAARKSATGKSSTAKSTPRATAARRRTAAPERDSHGRFKADHHVRNAAFGATAALGAVAAGVAAAFKFGLLDRFLPRAEGHEAEDLLLDADDQRRPTPTRRAPKAFRPDVDAPMTSAEKDALRPPAGTPAAGLAAADNGVVEPA